MPGRRSRSGRIPERARHGRTRDRVPARRDAAAAGPTAPRRLRCWQAASRLEGLGGGAGLARRFLGSPNLLTALCLVEAVIHPLPMLQALRAPAEESVPAVAQGNVYQGLP